MQVLKTMSQVARSPWLVRTAVPWRRYIFVDCGGNNGCSVRKFREQFDLFERFFVYSFEPNTEYESAFSGFARHELVPAAVDVKDGMREFFLDPEDGDGSTFFKHKLTRESGGFGALDLENPVEVPTVDLSGWLAKACSKRDFVVLKLDVEGAEYDILEKLFNDNTIRLVNRLFIEWHWEKVGVARSRHDGIVRRLAKVGVPIEEWDAQGS